MQLGYARISTNYQNLDGQIEVLKKYGVLERNIFKEQISATAKRRPELDRLLSYLRKDDVLVIYKLDRLGRSIRDLLHLIDLLNTNGIRLVSITENLDTQTASGKLLFHMLATLAQFERDLLTERVKNGMIAAKKKGIHCGRKEKMTTTQKYQAKQFFEEGKSIKEIASIFNISRTPIYRLLKN